MTLDNESNMSHSLVNDWRHVIDHYYDTLTISCKCNMFSWTFSLVAILGLVSGLVWLRTSYSRSVRWSEEQVDAAINLMEYIDRLVDSNCARPSILSPDLLNESIKIKLNEQEERFYVKRPREYSWLKRVYYILYDRGWRGLFPSRQRVLPTFDDNESNKLKTSWLIYVCLRKEDDMVDEENTISMALNRYLCQLPVKHKTPKYMFKQVLYFTRMCGYLMSQKVPLLPYGVDWHDTRMVKMLCDMGQFLPPDQYVVQIDMARPITSDILTIRLKIDFPFRRTTEKARLQYDQAKLNALQQLKKAKRRAFEVWGLFDDGPVTYRETEAFQDLQSLLVEEEKVQKYRNNRNITVAYTEHLRTMPKMTIQEALKDAQVIMINAFAKRVHVKGDKDDCTAELRRILLAIKLGITIDILDCNLGFEEFATKNHLHRYLFVQKHELSTNLAGTLAILRNGTLRLWPDIQNNINVDPTTGVMLGQYNYLGLIDRGVYDWEVLTPFYIEPQSPPPWGNRYLFEFCSWIIDRPRMMGDHTYIRLKTPQGEWYSVGQYRPQKMGFHEQFVFPMKIKVSKFMSPDVSEYWNGPFTSLSVEITKEQFEKMKAQIEHDQINGDHTYQLFHGNCTKYAKSIATIAGLDLPSSIPILEVLVSSQTLKNRGRKALNWKYLPKWIKPFLKWCWTVSFNLFGLVFGSGMIDDEIRNMPKFKGIRPFIGDLHDLTNPDKTITDHPFIVGHYVTRIVDKWRKERSIELNAQLAALRKSVTRLTNNNGRVTRSKSGQHTQLATLNGTIAALEQELDGIPYALPDRFRKRPAASSSSSPDNTGDDDNEDSNDNHTEEIDSSTKYIVDDPLHRIWQETD